MNDLVAFQDIPLDLAEILNFASNGLVVVNRQGNLVYCNNQAKILFGTPNQDVLGRNIVSIMPGTGLQRVIATGQQELGQRLYHDGLILLSNRTPVFKDDQVIGAMAVFQDITEIQGTIDDLANDNVKIRELQGILETVINLAYEGLVVVNKEKIITMANQSYANFFNATPEDLIGKHVTEVYDNPKFPEVMVTGKPVFGYIHNMNGHNIIASRIPIKRDGEIVGAIGKVVFRNVNELYSLVEKVEQLHGELEYYKGELQRVRNNKFTFDQIYGQSPKFLALKETAKRVAKSNSTVLIRGESGTGKELFAYALHVGGMHSQGPFVKVNCAAMPDTLLESELFGYQEGAFTGAKKGGKVGKFELANNGTIFLDEIGDMPLHMQAKLLRVLQEREIERLGDSRPLKINVRVIAATNKNLEQAIWRKEFREDLYYRLNVVTLSLPPLRERMDDMELLINVFIDKFNLQFGQRVQDVSPEALKLLYSHDWPGNVRELENVIERSFNVLDGDCIGLRHLPMYLQELNRKTSRTKSQPLSAFLEEVERKAISDALSEAKGNKVLVAQILGLSRSGLYKKLEKYNLGLN